MKILLTGATGFIGSHMLKGLLRENNNSVHVLKRRTSIVPHLTAAEDLNVRYFDIDTEISKSSAFDHEYSAVIHLATHYGKNPQEFLETAKTNVYLPLELLKQTYLKGCRLFISTDSFFSAPRFAYPHMAEYNLTKRQFLDWGKLLSNTLDGLVFVNMRLEHVYGLGDGKDKFVPFILNRLQSCQPEIPLTSGEQLRDFIYIDDVVCAYLTVLRSKLALSGFNEFEVGTGTSISVRRLVEIGAELTNSTSNLHFGAIPQRDREIMESKADITALSALGWRPTVTLQSGLEKILS